MRLLDTKQQEAVKIFENVDIGSILKCENYFSFAICNTWNRLRELKNEHEKSPKNPAWANPFNFNLFYYEMIICLSLKFMLWKSEADACLLRIQSKVNQTNKHSLGPTYHTSLDLLIKEFQIFRHLLAYKTNEQNHQIFRKF